MKKSKFAYTLILSLGFAIPALSGCSSSGGSGADIVLRMTNCEDYMNEGSEAESFTFSNGEEFDDVLDGFEQYYEELTGKSVSIVYDTYDTNETMYSGLQTGKTQYDLICASDYTIQKMMANSMLQPIKSPDEDYSESVPNYEEYCPEYLRDTLDGLEANVEGYSEPQRVGDYAVGYMWGTLGILYNPAKLSEECGVDYDEVISDMNSSWSVLWDSKYHGQMSIKDSMRDTYSVGMMKLYEDSFLNEGDPSAYLASSGYSEEQLSTIFNLCDEETTIQVQNALLELKDNVFGFEVDSGKDDIVKGMIGINLAWSGDAVYSISVAAEENDETLYYSVPESGGNIWFDAWCMPSSVTGDNRECALAFLDFLSDPTVAVANMNYIGYTSFIGGDDVHLTMLEWYDPRTYEMYQYDEENDDFVYDDEGNYVYIEGMEGSTYAAPGEDSGYSSWEEYNEGEELGWSTLDLSYMFSSSTSSEYIGELGYDPTSSFEGATSPDESPYIYYTYDPEGDDAATYNQFVTQYPDNSRIEQEGMGELCVMQDFGSNNRYVLTMWENVKSNSLPTWGIIFLCCLLGLLLAGTGVYLYKRHKTNVVKRERKNKAK
ncbi:MAG: extracellular solute-binding protein [Bacillota bacterium]|nr:extracellular solute-binding protein [Bacillota bacterium]